MPRTNDPGRSVSSRLLQLLFAFGPGKTEMSLAELVRATGIPHATARRLTLELLEAGALDRKSNGRFTVGLRLWQLGTLSPRTESLRTLARPFMSDLHTAIGQHVQLAVPEEGESVVVERRSEPQAPHVRSRVGGRLPLHCSGSGKVLLAHAAPELIEEVLSGPLRRYTDRTLVSPDVLRRELADCRRTGTATVRGELTEKTDSVATRIVDGEGHVVASLSVIVAAGAVRVHTATPTLIASGLGISRRLGWRPGIAVRQS